MTLRHWAVAGLVLAMAGCGMPNDAIVKEVEYCHAHGMDAEYVRFNGGAVSNVQCVPKGDSRAEK